MHNRLAVNHVDAVEQSQPQRCWDMWSSLQALHVLYELSWQVTYQDFYQETVISVKGSSGEFKVPTRQYGIVIILK